jgi:hypothetical protein
VRYFLLTTDRVVPQLFILSHIRRLVRLLVRSFLLSEKKKLNIYAEESEKGENGPCKESKNVNMDERKETAFEYWIKLCQSMLMFKFNSAFTKGAINLHLICFKIVRYDLILTQVYRFGIQAQKMIPLTMLQQESSQSVVGRFDRFKIKLNNIHFFA